MIKLTKQHTNERHAVIRVEGRLDSETVRELDSFIGGLTGLAQVTLDLSGLASIDHEGRSALMRLQTAGRHITGASLYIHRLLQEAQP